MSNGTVYLCGGLQSSGSTLFSWCFLQRADTDGVLDHPYDIVPALPPNLSAPRVWCKFTIACFRLTEVVRSMEDNGYDVRPVLLTRDVRAVFNSLVTKKYGRNGTTADDPPIRLRLRRYLEDWHAARDRGWPVYRYEDLVAAPEETLRRACNDLALPWDESMLTWPKRADQIAAAANGNATFASSRGAGGGLRASLVPSLADVRTDRVPPEDLEWMEREFAEMNGALGYSAHVASTAVEGVPRRAVPNFECTRRCRHERRKRKKFRPV